MRRAAPVVEQPALGEHERAGAHGAQARARVVGASQPRQRGVTEVGQVAGSESVLVGPGDEDRIVRAGRDRVERCQAREAQSLGRFDLTRQSDELRLVAGSVEARLMEHLRGAGQVQHLHSRQYEKHDPTHAAPPRDTPPRLRRSRAPRRTNSGRIRPDSTGNVRPRRLRCALAMG